MANRSQYAETAYQALGVGLAEIAQGIDYLLEIDGGFISQDEKSRHAIAHGLANETAIALVEAGVTLETLNFENTEFSAAVLKALVLRANGVV